MKDKMSKKNLQDFFDMLGKLYGDKHNVKVTYKLTKKRRRRLRNASQDKE